MKGQFFIIGAVLLAIAFFVALPHIRPFLTSPSQDMPFLSKNLKAEFPAAFNLGLNQSEPIKVMKNFSLFLNESLHDHLIDFTTLWVYSENSTTDVNFTLGNFLKQNITVTLSISTTSEEVLVTLNDTNSSLFTSPGSVFNLTISFNSQEKTVEWLRDKSSLYVFFQLQRGNDIIIEEVSV